MRTLFNSSQLVGYYESVLQELVLPDTKSSSEYIRYVVLGTEDEY